MYISYMRGLTVIHLSGDKLACLEISHKPKPLSEKKKIKAFNTLLDSFCINCILNSNQQYTSILQSCKVESDDTQSLINVRHRGGFWSVNKRIENVFLGAELLFQSKTSSFKTAIICKDIVTELLQDSSVLSYYNETCLDANLQIKKGGSSKEKGQ